jgi:hypothetical protein
MLSSDRTESKDMNNSFRLSRVTTPRATLWSIVLLTLVLCIFGLSASAAMPANDAAITSHQLVAEPLAQLLGLVGRG